MPRGIYKRTEEQKKKISETLKKKRIVPPSRKGVSWSKNQRINYKKGIKKVDMSWWKIGKKHSQKHKEKISKALKGKITWNKGIPQSLEQRKKMSVKFKGSGGPGWKGGITSINGSIRKSLEYTLWREAVFKRDNYTCQRTGVKGGKLVAHHINSFNKNKELRFVVSNGITLSKLAHKEFHHLYGNRNNNREQLNEFLLT